MPSNSVSFPMTSFEFSVLAVATANESARLMGFWLLVFAASLQRVLSVRGMMLMPNVLRVLVFSSAILGLYLWSM